MLQLVETQPLKYPTYRQEGSRLYKQDVQKRLETAHAKAKRRYDLRKRPQQFEEGTSVWKKKLCPYVGPFMIKKRISPLTYELADDTGQSKGVWHTKDLKPIIGDDTLSEKLD
ncbi:hypothetical protein PPYR_04811 [Photinus pyralis]|uniref:Uncharacterized protein n=1 Tax=Photinus pyralis TaxID=7054 RepID=A0A5N4AZ54_PHOPY|nr:hypothetical protein PPYR_11584 [Photinus pyralis]KAB0802625.1 hypothetical protein PPYR_04811 [Photinus pyralis]